MPHVRFELFLTLGGTATSLLLKQHRVSLATAASEADYILSLLSSFAHVSSCTREIFTRLSSFHIQTHVALRLQTYNACDDIYALSQFLVDQNGVPVARYAPATSPLHLEADIERLLQPPSPAPTAS